MSVDYTFICQSAAHYHITLCLLQVYLGAPNARSHAPAPHSYIDNADFPGPEALASFLLELASDEPRYRAYSAWKRARPFVLSPGFNADIRNDALRGGQGSVLCRLCRLVANTSQASSMATNTKTRH
jgi:hypothetical protein